MAGRSSSGPGLEAEHVQPSHGVVRATTEGAETTCGLHPSNRPTSRSSRQGHGYPLPLLHLGLIRRGVMGPWLIGQGLIS